MRRAGWTGRVLAASRVDLEPSPRQPRAALVAAATVASLAASLSVDRLLVLVGTSLFPSTAGYVHFRFSDYAELTVIGVVVACLAWPVVARVTSQPRWLFFRLAIAVMVVLLLPDGWLLTRGQPSEAVAVLMAMHVAIALVTYNLLVHVASAGTASRPGSVSADATGVRPGWAALARRQLPARAVWIGMVGLLVAESALGIAALVVVPTGRPSAWVPADGRAVYLAHAIVGAVMGVGALVLLVTRSRADRLSFNCALIGLAGTAIAAGGGSLTAYKDQRLLGIGLMLVGALVAGFAYLTPATE